MELLCIGALDNINTIVERLKKEFSLLKQKGIDVTINRNLKGDYTFLSCCIPDDDILNDSYEDVILNFNYHAARAITDIITNDLEQKIIRDIIKENFSYFNSRERETIQKYTARFLNYDDTIEKDNTIQQLNKKMNITSKVIKYLEFNNQINIEGFIKFRLKDYLTELEDLVEKAVDEFLMEKEYREFIKLLKYFVEVQEPKRDIIHVLIKSKGFKLLDEKLNCINGEFLNDFENESSENEINHDDLLISVLITIAPRKIIIHERNVKINQEVIETLKNIFDGKISFCRDCKICRKINNRETSFDTKSLK
jgi:putative sporulation protein YtxC